MRGVILFAWLLSAAPLPVFGAERTDLIVFYAPAYAPVMETVAVDLEQTLKVNLRAEIKGSQVLCRQVADLGRECDLILLADAELFKTLAYSRVHWRLEFAHDEVVLGVGRRARRTDEAEHDWARVLQDPKIVLGRVNESLAPIGYRTLLVWRLQEKRGYPNLLAALRTKTAKVLDQADHLSALLQNGDIDYGFLYKTTCLQCDIRFISLAPEINLGHEDYDYSKSQITYTPAGSKNPLTVHGFLVTYGMSIPDNAPHPLQAQAAIRYLLKQRAQVFTEKGYLFFKPKFYGPKTAYPPFAEMADYAGNF